MKLLSSLCIAAMALFAVGCADDPASPGSNNTGDSFWPSSKGSTWTYAGSQNYTVTAGGDTTVQGKQYTAMYREPGGTSLLRRDGASYYNTDVNNTAEILFLKDGGVGTTWSHSIPVQGMPNNYEYKIEEVGKTHVVNGQSYSNVMRVHLNTTITFAGQTITAAQADYYYAKGVGLIQADLGTLGVVNLISYSIK
jgi:hypothetical protein